MCGYGIRTIEKRHDDSNEGKGQGSQGCHIFSGVRSEKAAIDAGCRDDVPSEMVDRVITKELKTVKEQLDTCPAEREDLQAEYQKRYDVIAEYAPKMMSAEEVRSYIETHFAELVATKNKGQIMKAVMGELKGKADGRVINEIVAELCK